MNFLARFFVFLYGGLRIAAAAGARVTTEIARQAHALARLSILIALGLTLFWSWMSWRELARRQPPVISLEELSVTVPSGGAVELDRAALGQAAPGQEATGAALVLEHRQAPGGLVLRNAAQGRRLLFDDADGRIASDRWKLSEGATAHLPNGAVLRFSAARPEGFDLAVTGSGETEPRLYRIRGEGVARFASGEARAIPPCDPNGGFRWPRWGVFGGEERLIAFVGGQADCDEKGHPHLALNGLPWRMLRIVQRADSYFLTPDRGGGQAAASIRLQGASGSTAGFSDLPWSAKGVEQVMIGRTRYALDVFPAPAGATRIVFTPREGTSVFPSVQEGRQVATPACGDICPRWSRPYRVLERLAAEGFSTRLGGGETVLRFLVGLAPLAIVFLTGPLRRRSPWRSRGAGSRLASFQKIFRDIEPSDARALALVLLSTLLALTEPAWFGVDPMAALAMNWTFAGFALLFLRPAGLLAGLFWLSIALMAMLGGLTLSGMAADGDSDLWAAHLIKHKLLVLDLLPPYVVALALASPRAMRPWIHGLVLGRDWLSRTARYGPLGLLLLVLSAWLLFGGETGLAGFQPVEAGKFATALLCAGLAAVFDSSRRNGSTTQALTAQSLSLAILAGFFSLLIFAPTLQSDFSPALIIGLLGLSIGGVYLALRLAAWIGAEAIRIRERRRAPVAFLPVPWLPRTERRLAALLAAAAIVGAVALWFGAKPASQAGLRLTVGLDSWPKTATDQLAQLQENFGGGARVPTERVIAWIDLDYSRFEQDGAALAAAYRDLEYQVIRSRAVISSGACGLAEPLDAAAEALPVPAFATSAARESWTDWSRRHGVLCAPRAGATGADEAHKPRNTLFDGRPIDIPVVQFDFAASYLMGRFGLGAATLFYAGQALCVLTALLGLTRLVLAGEGDGAGRTIRWFLAILMAGSTTLFLLHWMISWSNALGLWPVMGQPMTWLSAATSHHLFMAFPATLAILIGLVHGEFDTRRVLYRVPPERQRRIFAW